MKQFVFIIVLVIAVSFLYTAIAQELGSLQRWNESYIPQQIENPTPEPLHSNVYTVGNGGYFPTIQSAFDKLSANGIDGEVTLELINTTYVATNREYGFILNGPIPGADHSRRVIIKPAANKNVTIMGNSKVILFFYNASFITLDGVATQGSTTLTIRALENLEFPYNDCVAFWNNSDHNLVKNLTILSEDYKRYGSGIVIWNQPNSISPPDHNQIQNNFIKKAGVGILVLGYGVAVTSPNGNIIRGNKIGSETDNKIAWGIDVEVALNTIIENNNIQNVRYYDDIETIGINTFGGYGTIIRNNFIHNLFASRGQFGAVGILLSGSPGPGSQGSNNIVYNNMIYDIRSYVNAAEATVAGIQMWNQYHPQIYYNSICLKGSGYGANHEGSGALYIYSSCSNVVVNNNILVNTRDESPYCASSIYFNGNFEMINSDYNDLHYVQNPNNCLVRSSGGDYFNLAEWQTTGQDVNSVSGMPPFVDGDLHIDSTFSLIDGRATPVWGITKDIDGDPRDWDMPDIGADEFVWVPVELTSFTATVNGREILLRWSTATEINNLGFEIQRNTEGTEFYTIGFVDGHGTTTEQQQYSFADRNLDNGKYYYRLKQVDFNGTYDYSDVIEVEWRAFNSYLLEQNYPNPFNPTTKIGFGVQGKSNVKITVLNAIGEEVAVILNEEKDSGYYTVEFNASNLPSGVYLYQLKAGTFVQVKKMILMK